MTNTDTTHDKVEAAKAAAMEIRYNDGIPIRVFLRKGMVIWSEVDDQMRDLTDENSEGRLYHVRSVFVPHGAQNPLTALRNQLSVDDVIEQCAKVADKRAEAYRKIPAPHLLNAARHGEAEHIAQAIRALADKGDA